MDESFSNFWEVTKSVFIPLEVTESVARQIFNCGWKARDREVAELTLERDELQFQISDTNAELSERD